MSPPVSNEAIKQKLAALHKDSRFQRFKTLLDSADSLVGIDPSHPAAADSLDTARLLLDVVVVMQRKVEQGVEVNSLVREVQSGGFVQPGWNVEGPVNQANRDIINNYVIKIFTQKAGDLTADAESVVVPVVLLVMKDSEAAELTNGNAFIDTPAPATLRHDFQPLLDLLNANLPSWEQHYGPAPTDWKPPNGPNNETIGELINRELNDIYKDNRFDRPLVADFIDIRRLNMRDRRQPLRDLREKGCLVVIDAVSMRHPALLRCYHASLLEASLRVSHVRLAPLANAVALVREMKVALEWSIADLEFDLRRLDKYDDDSCRDFSDFDEFPKWFYAQMKKILPAAAVTPSGILREIRQQ